MSEAHTTSRISLAGLALLESNEPLLVTTQSAQPALVAEEPFWFCSHEAEDPFGSLYKL